MVMVMVMAMIVVAVMIVVVVVAAVMALLDANTDLRVGYVNAIDIIIARRVAHGFLFRSFFRFACQISGFLRRRIRGQVLVLEG